LSSSKRKATEKVRKTYEKPTATKLTPEKAKEKLLKLVKRGDQGAKEMLEKMFPDEAERDPTRRKKSA
jgi:hypothetical protein